MKKKTFKEIFGTNPRDPWSAKANIAEDDLNEDKYLDAFLLHRGLNPNVMNRMQKVNYARSTEYKTYKQKLSQQESVIFEGVVDYKDIAQELVNRHGSEVLPEHIDELQHEMDSHHALDKDEVMHHVKMIKQISEDARIDRLKRTTDMIRGRVPGGKADDVGPGADGKSTKYALKSEDRTTTTGPTAKQANQIRTANHAHDEIKTPRGPGVREDTVSEVSDKTLTSYLTKVDADSRKSKMDPTKRPAHKANKSVMGFSRAFNKLDSRKGVAEGLTEMDKSVPQPGRDGRVSHSTYGSRDKKGSDYFKGKEAPGKPVNTKQMSKDSLDILKKQGVAEEQINELKKSTLASYVKGAMADKEMSATSSSFKSGKAGDAYNKSDESPRETKRAKGIDRALNKLSKESVLVDNPQGTMTRVAEKSKAAKRIMEIVLSSRKINEDLYDHEKQDKMDKGLGNKQPKLEKADKKDSEGEKKPQAAAVLSGGKTMTGQERDIIELDPLMRNRPNQPDVTKKDDKKDDKKKDK